MLKSPQNSKLLFHDCQNLYVIRVNVHNADACCKFASLATNIV